MRAHVAQPSLRTSQGWNCARLGGRGVHEEKFFAVQADQETVNVMPISASVKVERARWLSSVEELREMIPRDFWSNDKISKVFSAKNSMRSTPSTSGVSVRLSLYAVTTIELATYFREDVLLFDPCFRFNRMDDSCE